ncbi:MAG: hypothetical protein IKN83_04715 [Bacteroidaceae bacterium]|nr:hypothetical protein [Bacteroidaceae bacterium]
MEKKYIKPEITVAQGYVLCKILDPTAGVASLNFAMGKDRNTYDENENKFEEKYGEIQNTIW